ncbi:MAG: hypothetical protein QW620_04090 [Thermoplasmata archaeon]
MCRNLLLVFLILCAILQFSAHQIAGEPSKVKTPNLSVTILSPEAHSILSKNVTIRIEVNTTSEITRIVLYVDASIKVLIDGKEYDSILVSLWC